MDPSSYLFGNVDGEGEVDNGLDDETRSYLSSVGSLLGRAELFDIKGLAKKDKDDMDDEDYDQKSENAIDFEDMDELADEIEDGTVPSPDSDNMMADDNAVDMSSQFKKESTKQFKPFVRKYLPPPPSATESGSEIPIDSAIEAVLNKTATEMTPAIKRVCSALHSERGPILKFSEIFGPRHGVAPVQPKRQKPAQPEEQPKFEYDDDETDTFDTSSHVYTLYETPQRPISSAESFDEEASSDEMSLDDSTTPLPSDLPQSPDFSGVQYQAWENDIVWGNGAYTDSTGSQVCKDPSVMVTDLQVWHPDKPQEPPKISGDLIFPEEPTHLNWSLFPLPNEKLDEGDWTDSVVWDKEDEDFIKTVKTVPLLFDLNDKEMLFDEHIKKPSTPSTPASGSSGTTPITPSLNDSNPRKRRPKRHISEIESMIREQTEEELDPFNWSLDRMYAAANMTKIRQKNIGRPLVQHSVPAIRLSLFRTHLTTEELRFFRRPLTKFPANKRIKIGPVRSRDSSRSQKRKQAMRHKADLSSKDGRIILVESMEERPALIMNVGMGTKLLNYYRKHSTTDLPCDTLEDGESVILGDSDESPFLGEVEPGQTIQALDNNMFRAPLVYHKPSRTDFLLIRGKGGRAYIREISACYAVGQQEPMVEVPAPNSRSANNYVKNRLQAYIYRLFKKRSDQQRLRIADICAAFPNQSETSIRKRLKDCADFQRGGDDSGWWTVKPDFELPNEDELKSLLTPEAVCAYESMLAGIQHLQDVGVDHTTNLSGLGNSIAQLEEETGGKLEDATRFLKEEILLAPWNITSNFVNAMNGKGLLELTGFGDPSGCGAGYSYMRMPQKAQQQQKAQQPKAAVTGTDADLRKLSLDNARKVLLDFGVADEYIQQLSRWERIDLVRKKSSAAAAMGDNSGIKTKFARGSKSSVHAQQAQYREECQIILEKQLALLGDENPDVSSEDEEEVEDNAELQDLAGELESALIDEFSLDDDMEEGSGASRMEDDNSKDEEEKKNEH